MRRSRESREHVNVPDWGVDVSLTSRPGVPKEVLPPKVIPRLRRVALALQVPHEEVLKRAELAELTPVFGTASPPHGISGELRRIAYNIPDYKVRHWMLLLLADRVDAVESDPLDFARHLLGIP